MNIIVAKASLSQRLAILWATTILLSRVAKLLPAVGKLKLVHTTKEKTVTLWVYVSQEILIYDIQVRHK